MSYTTDNPAAANPAVAASNTLKDNELEIRYEKYRMILKNLTIMSDVFMRNVLKKQECTEHILRVIMEKDDLEVVEQTIQQDYKNLQGRSAILDCVARDATDKRYDIEIQQDHEGASPKRARYYSALMDMNTLEAGQDFDLLPESHVIFITKDDTLGYGLQIYHVGRRIDEVQETFPDESHIIYVNSAVQDETSLGRLMHDLHCADPDEMYSDILAQRVREIKETEGGVDSMCREMDQIYNEGIKLGEKRGIEQGKIEEKKQTAQSLAQMKMPVEMIAEAVRVSTQVVQEWLAGNQNLLQK